MLSTFDDFVKALLAVLVGLVGYYLVARVLSSAAEEQHTAIVREKPFDLDFGPDKKRQPAVLLHKAGFAYECIECHSWQERNPDPREFIGEHSLMNLEHGSVKSCFTCHHEAEYDQLVDPQGGGPLAYNQHVKLCARCHGPIFSDWKNGAHGRRAGYWDKSAGPQTKTDCIICHDPHQPAFKPIAPLPPPGVARGKSHLPSGEPKTTVGKLLKYLPPPPPAEREAAEPDDEWEVSP